VELAVDARSGAALPVDGRRSAALASPRGRVGLAGLLITGLLISLSAAHTELLLPSSLRPVPAWLTGAFGHVGLDIGLPGLDLETDRVMLCGSPSMLDELRVMFTGRGFVEGSHSEPGHFVIEKAFAER